MKLFSKVISAIRTPRGTVNEVQPPRGIVKTAPELGEVFVVITVAARVPIPVRHVLDMTAREWGELVASSELQKVAS